MSPNDAKGSGSPKGKNEPLFEEDDDLNDAGLYDLAEDSEEKPAPPRTVRKPAAPAAGGSGGGGGRGGQGHPTGSRPPAGPKAAKGHVAAPSAMETGAVMAAGRTRPISRSNAQERALAIENIKRIGLVAVGLAVLVVAVLLIRNLGGTSGPVVGDDAEAGELVGFYEEINTWLDSGANQRTLMGHSPARSQSRADELYELGAVKVLAGGGIQSSRIVVELPTDAPTREALIDWANEWHAKYGIHDRMNQTDEGQKYLVVEMPLNS